MSTVAPSRTFASLALALALLLSTAAQPDRTAAQPRGPLLSGAPNSLAATVNLGASTTLSLSLQNQSAQSIAPRLYEALAPDAQPAAPAGDTSPVATTATAPTDPPAIDPQIAVAQATTPDRRAEIIVLLDDQADLSPAYGIAGWAARGQYVYTTLRDHAERSQRDLRATLDARGLAYTPLWIVNAIAVEATAEDVAAIASVQSVAAMWSSHLADLGAPPAQGSPGGCEPDADNTCWNIARIGAGRVWDDLGIRGGGITVASIDSGVRFDHPALAAQYRGSEPGGPRHDYSWYDPYGGAAAPVDAGNHGTHTMGTMVARGLSAAQPAVGVAPGARWITARACSSRSCNEVDLIRAAQWMLAPTDLAGNNPRPDLRPHVINNSWTGGRNASWFLGYVEAWRAAGIYPVFAAGNAGSLVSCSTVQSPGDYALVTGVGSTDSADALSSFSGIGPTLGGRLKPDLVAPGQGIISTVADGRDYGASSGTSMAAPHVAGAVALLWSANPQLIGDYGATYSLLTTTATPRTGDSRFLGPSHENCRPTASPNNIYGHGRLDVYSAVARATVDVPWLRLPAAPLAAIAPAGSTSLAITLDARMVPGPGTYEARILIHGPNLALEPAVVTVSMSVPADPSHATVSGRVTGVENGAPVQATVRVAGGATVTSDTDGRYSVILPPAAAPYTLSATARGYLASSAPAALVAGEQRTLDFALTLDKPRLAAETRRRAADLSFRERENLTFPVANNGTQPLRYTARVLDEHFGVWRSDEPDGPAATWTDPPADAITVTLTDDGATGPLPIGFPFPFYDGTHERFTITANGVIALEPFPAAYTFTRKCLPLSETNGPAIVPLRLDIDPSKPDARVSYARSTAGLLITWENVPLYQRSDARVSFQALLMPDGRISLRYKDISAVAPAELPAAGVQHHAAQVQSLGCKDDLALSDGLTIELRPQQPTTVWLALGSPEGTIAPGGQADVAVTARWLSANSYARSFSGAIELRSNDPSAPVTRLTVRMQTTPAPHTVFLPRTPRL